jgi:hypothetical protein
MRCAHRVDALDRVVDADRQHQRRQAEAVAQLARPVRSAAGSPAPWRGSPCRSGSSPCARSKPPMAPATQDSSTSLIEHPSALPTTFTRSSGIGSLQATTLAAAGLPFRRWASRRPSAPCAATSLSTCSPERAMSSEPQRLRGWASMSIDLATPLPYMSIALTVMSVSGLSTASASQSPSPSSSTVLRRASGGSLAAVGDRHRHLRSARCRRRCSGAPARSCALPPS